MSKILNLISLSTLVGLVSGTLSALFLHSLSFVTDLRQSYPFLIWGLPVFGFFFGIVLKKIPHHINQGVPYILKELDNPEAKVSRWMAPFVFISSIGTHLFGGSAGREGVGVIMGASSAHLFRRFPRKFLIYTGIAAGFSSIFGTPLAGIVFSFELYSFQHKKELDLIFCTVLAAFIGLIVPHFLGPAHSHFEVSFHSKEIIFYVFLTGVVSGLGAHLFYWGHKAYTKLISTIFPDIIVKLTLGGLVISLLVFFTDSYQYIGIGSDIIAKSFTQEMSYYDFAMKALLTIMTISIGFKGGEVTPLFFMGSTLSNWLCSFFHLRNFGLSSALGMVALFGSVTAAPMASTIMGAELFGWEVGCICFVSCVIAKFIMGKRSVYKY